MEEREMMIFDIDQAREKENGRLKNKLQERKSEEYGGALYSSAWLRIPLDSALVRPALTAAEANT